MSTDLEKPDVDDIHSKSSHEDGVPDHNTLERGERDTNDVEKQESSQPQQKQQPSSSNLAAWRRVAGAWLLFVASWGPALAYGSFETYYASTLLPNYSSSQLAWIGSISTLLLVCSGAFAGPLFDRGYLRPILCLGCLVVVFSLEMLSLCTEYYQLILAQGVGYGIGSGLVYVPALAFVTVSFEAKTRPYAVGVVTTGAGLAGVIYPIIISRLVQEIGFPWTCRFLGFFSLVLSIVGLLLVWDAPTKKTKPRSLIEWKAFTEVPFVSMCVIAFLQFLGYWIPVFYVASFASSRLGVSEYESLYFICLVSAGSIVGRIFPAYLVAKFGAWPVLFFATAATAIILFCWIAVTSYAGFVVWCLAVGFTSGVFVSVNPVVVAQRIISPPEVIGTRLGIVWFMAAVGALIGTPIAGWLADPETGMFLHAQIFTACIMTGATFGILIPWHYWRRDQRQKAQA